MSSVNQTFKLFSLRALILILVFTCVLSCSTAPVDAFSSVKDGMSKSDVIELIGSPQKTERKNQEDIWTYKFYSKHMESAISKDAAQDTQDTREVRFKDGHVTYVGDVHRDEDTADISGKPKVWPPPKEIPTTPSPTPLTEFIPVE